ncbi:hypothetical protein [Myroides odoratus]|uniref:Type IV secretion protein Rhs n=1 Tax=Myroides odoratus TaxID=256 RepID=A0A9Q6Z419_MYROD|nr:hypothetical protein [Myroides odoratus]EKB08417.1 RHS repeat-associated core domain-containing protein [Myroides odoratus CIP 103059]EHQ40953.1 hypothetical protein Myrod_0107 [Myroides odoratus DSM 2801]QQU01898.1 type IV secretion protein Rhs [Myroides odoratus]WQD55813.1 type IV secretion protein Rhs [Myroides odoratus]STZ31985.1 RHS repeat-associated core domain [Myroides odoratus]
MSIFLSVDPLAEQFPTWTPYHYVHNNPINLVDPTGMKGEDWYMNNETKKVTWIDGSKNIKGHTNLGYSYGENKTDYLVMHGSTRQTTVNGNVIADFNKKGSIQQDGLMVLGTGADPMDSAIGRDRGQGSIEVGDSDVNAFYALMNKVLSYFKDEVIKSNKATESATPLKSSQEKSETMTFKMKGYQNKDLFDRSDEATVRWSKDTVIDVKDLKKMEARNKADSLYNANKNR